MPGESKFDAIKEPVMEIVNKWKAEKPDSVGDFFRFSYSVVGDLVDLVEKSSEIVNGPDKKATVIEGLQYAYNEVDPDLPWIPEPFESKLETWFLNNGIPFLIDFLVEKYNEEEIFLSERH